MMHSKQSGFSLIELMVAAFLTVGLMGGIFMLSNQSQRTFVTESSVTDMNQNVRTAMDMVTRDVQSAGGGLPVGTANFAAVFYRNGAAGAPDALLLVNGDPFAPTGDVAVQTATTFSLIPPADVTPAPLTGPAQLFTYTGYQAVVKPVYRSYANDPRLYLVYDQSKSMIFRLTANASATGVAPSTRLLLTYDNAAANFLNPATVFQTTVGATVVDTGAPTYVPSGNSRVAPLVSTIGYRVNTATGELLRTEDLVNWYAIARGIVDFQIQFHLVRSTAGGVIEEKITSDPGNGIDAAPSGELTARKDIHSLIITLVVETPDLESNNKSYRRVTHSFEVTARNLNLLNNDNVR